MNIPKLSYCNLLIDRGYSLLTVGEKKTPNYAWTKMQTNPLSKYEFEKRYSYNGGYKYTDESGIEHEIAPTKGIGIITGYDGLQGVDVDLKVFSTLKARQDFWNEYYQFLQDNISDFDKKFVVTKTKNDGYHIIFKCDEIEGNKVLASRPATKEELEINPKAKARAIIETRGKYGYLFIYENFVSKLRYEDVQWITPLERDVLFECSRFYHQPEKEPEKVPKTIQKEYKEAEITPWEDYNNKVDIFDIISDEFSIPARGQKSKFTQILRHGSDAAHSGYIFNDSGCMYLFSTGTRYPHETLISPFKAYAIKHHNGDFSAAASELYRQGYGSRKIKRLIVADEKPEIETNNEFPIDVFPPFLQHYLIECNRTLNSSIDYMSCGLLWLFSIMIGNHTKVKIKNGWTEKAILWISIVGKAGLGKTPSIKNVLFPIEKANSREIKKYIKDYEKYEAYLNLSADEKKQSETIKKPRKTQFIANDITMEALVGLHEENKNAVGVFKDELAGWIKDMNKYRAGSDVETWLSAWSGTMINVNRKTAKSAFLENPFISVLGGIQPSILTQFFTQENKDNGFVDRLLICYPELEIEDFNDNEMDEDLILDYSESIIKFYEEIKKDLVYNDDEIQPNIATFDSDAKIEWLRIFREITNLQNSKNENEYMKSMYPKQKSYLARYALIIHVMNYYYNEDLRTNPINVISKESLLKAEKVMKYFIENAKKIKVDSVSMTLLRKIYKLNEMKPKQEIFQLMYEADPELNKTDAAEVLGVNRQMIYKYIKNIENENP
jgi:hypothetical protein